MPFDRVKSAFGTRGAADRLPQQQAGKTPLGSVFATPERPAGGGHLVADIGRIADEWHGRPVSSDKAAGGELPTPEALIAAADERDVDVSFEQRKLSSLDKGDFPCVILMKDGSSRLLVGRVGAEAFACDIDGRQHAIPIEALAADYSGTVFFVDPQRKTMAAEPEDAGADPVAAGEGDRFEIAREVFRHAMKTQRPLMLRLVLAAVLSNFLMITLPLFTMAVYDRVIPHLAMETLWALSLGVLIALGLDFGIRFVRLKLVDAIGLSTALTLQTRLYRRLLQARMAEAPRTIGGVMASIREFDSICQLVPALYVAAAADVPFFLVLIVLLYSIGGAVVIAPVVGVLALALVHAIGHVGMRESGPEAADLNRQQTNQMAETVGALEMVKANTAEDRLLRQWERVSDAASFAGHRGRLWTTFSGQSTMIVTQLVIVMVLIIGVHRIGAGAMTVGGLAASTLLVGRAISPIGQFISLAFRLIYLSQSTKGLSRLRQLGMEGGGDAFRPSARDIDGQIVFANVGFTYDGEPKAALGNINLTINPGETVALIGRIGSGKSSLLRLMLRFQEATSGTIFIDGHDIRQFSPRQLRRQIGFMRQDSQLFNDTLRANLTIGLDSVDEAAFERAAAISGVRDIAAKHPQGYSMRVGPGGERLSGGERQAVALARALVSEPRVLVLDEPTASMDNALEARIVRELRKYAVGRTLIVATHRAPLLELADRVIWVENGMVVADGPKAEVMKRLAGGTGH